MLLAGIEAVLQDRRREFDGRPIGMEPGPESLGKDRIPLVSRFRVRCRVAPEEANKGG